MSNTVFIVWRESVEAMLIVGILFSWLRNCGAGASVMRFLWAGIAGGIGLALVLGFVMLKIQTELAGIALDYFQLAIIAIAVILIVHMVLWMRKYGRTLKSSLETEMQQARHRNNWWRVTLLTAIAIGREGAETVIFLYGAGLANTVTSQLHLVLAAIIGLGLAFLTFWLLARGLRWFSWRVFFRVTEILLLLLASALLVDVVDRMIGYGWIPALIDPVWSSEFLLDDNGRLGGLIAAFTGYRANPALSLLLVYVLYWVVVTALLRKSSQSGQPRPA